jgi:hypothetical protein
MLTAQHHTTREAAKQAALEQIRRTSQRKELATIQAGSGKNTWLVEIEERAYEYYSVTGRCTRFDVYLVETNLGFLVAVPNLRKGGHVPADVNEFDVMNYLDVQNKVDAMTLAAALRWLIKNGYARKMTP